MTLTNTYPSSTAVGSIAVTKQVVGSAPAGAEFVVRVRCADGTNTEVRFPAQGGTEVVPVEVGQDATTCEVEETERGGAGAVRYAPGSSVTLDLAHAIRDVVVTNDFG